MSTNLILYLLVQFAERGAEGKIRRVLLVLQSAEATGVPLVTGRQPLGLGLGLWEEEKGQGRRLRRLPAGRPAMPRQSSDCRSRGPPLLWPSGEVAGWSAHAGGGGVRAAVRGAAAYEGAGRGTREDWGIWGSRAQQQASNFGL